MNSLLQRLFTRFRGDADRSSPTLDDFDDPVLLARTPGAETYHATRPDSPRPRCGGPTPKYRLVERTEAAADHDPCGNPACLAAFGRR